MCLVLKFADREERGELKMAKDDGFLDAVFPSGRREKTEVSSEQASQALELYKNLGKDEKKQFLEAFEKNGKQNLKWVGQFSRSESSVDEEKKQVTKGFLNRRVGCRRVKNRALLRDLLSSVPSKFARA